MEYLIELIAIGIGICLVALYYFLNQKRESTPKIVQKVEIEEKPKPNYGPILFLYGSQSGTASSSCNQLAEEAEKLGFIPKIVGLEHFKTVDFFKQICIFIVATHGEGEPTDNALEFYKWLTNKEEHPNLSGLKFTVFGLGNSQYEHFNAMGNKVNKYLEQFGGERIYKYGQGDDLGTREMDFAEWKTDIWKELIAYCELHPQKFSAEDIPLKAPPQQEVPISALIETDEEEANIFQISNLSDFELQTQNFVSSKPANILSIRELRQNDPTGSTLHIELEGIEYKTAQNLAIFPENDNSIVKELAKFLGVDLKTVLKLNPQSNKFKKLPFPSPISVENILSKFCDFQGPLQFDFLN